MRRVSGISGTLGERMAAGPRISRLFLLGSPSGREDSERKLSSSPRRAHGRPRPRGDIRSPGSDSGPHLQAPAAAGEAPRPATGGGSAERRRCSGGRPPLGSVRSPV